MPIRMAAGVLPFAPAVSVLGWLDIQNSPPAAARPASADIKLPQRLGDPSRRAEVVVVGEFLSLLNRLLREYVDTAILIENFAIGIAGVIDEAGVVPPYTGIDGGHFIHGKEKRMVALHCLFIVPLQLEIRPDPFTDIFDYARSFGDLDQRESATPLYPGLANDEIPVIPFAVTFHS